VTRKGQEADGVPVTPEIEALADALRGDAGPEGAERALTAFRQARRAPDQLGPWRSRRRDDWRPDRRRSALGISLRAGLGAALASVTIGGVALAVGTGVLPVPFAPADAPDRRPGPTSGVEASRTPGGTAPGRTSEPSGRSLPSSEPPVSAPGRDEPAANRAALCSAWSQGNRPRKGAAFQRLADAAGGEGAVDEYCASLPGEKTKVPRPPRRPTATAVPERSKAPQSASPSRGRSGDDAHGGHQRP